VHLEQGGDHCPTVAGAAVVAALRGLG